MSVVAFTVVCDSPDCPSIFVRHLCDTEGRNWAIGGKEE
jgi:hypothetical protein